MAGSPVYNGKKPLKGEYQMLNATIFGLLPIVIFFVVNWFAAGEFYKLAEDKGYHSRKYFWWAFLVPVVGYILIAAMPDRGADQRTVYNQDLPEL